MKRIFLDTNFIIDYLLRDEFKPMCQQFLAECSQRNYYFCVSFLTVANFAYVARKLPKEELYENLQMLVSLFDVVPNDYSQLSGAINLFASDFEDALQYEAAKMAQCKFIITRNQKDFPFSDIIVCSAQEFLQNYI